jgi:hypothetical protein
VPAAVPPLMTYSVSPLATVLPDSVVSGPEVISLAPEVTITPAETISAPDAELN